MIYLFLIFLAFILFFLWSSLRLASLCDQDEEKAIIKDQHI